MLKALIIFNLLVLIVNVLLLGNRDAGAGIQAGTDRSANERAKPTSSEPSTTSGASPGSGGLASQLGGGLPDGTPSKKPPVVTEHGESWHLPEGHLVIALYDSVRREHPPRLEDQIVGDLELTPEQRASMDEALSDTAKALMDHERAQREIRVDDQGIRYVYVPDYKDTAKRIFADLQAALANASSADAAAIIMIGVKSSIYFRQRGEEAKLTLGTRDGRPVIEDWRGDSVHRYAGFGEIHGIMHLPFDGSCDHLIDLEELGWAEK